MKYQDNQRCFFEMRMNREFVCNPAKVIRRKVPSPKGTSRHASSPSSVISRVSTREGVTGRHGGLEREGGGRVYDRIQVQLSAQSLDISRASGVTGAGCTAETG